MDHFGLSRLIAARMSEAKVGYLCFAVAYSLTTSFTRPVVISRVRVDGSCDSAIGSFVIVNTDGWILTAGHIIQEGLKMAGAVSALKDYSAARAAIENNKGLLREQKKKQLKKLAHPNSKDVVDYSFWWGADGVSVVDIHVSEQGDLAVARLNPFDGAAVANFPFLKDPSKSIASGTSLCRLGFPFHQITPTYADGRFQFLLERSRWSFFPMKESSAEC